ncbi:MAG: HAMP domain-containing histidine kinase [Deltaproteobacteria bacterium]|nr:HAMP domain-containing histidine kinase [Deltaproteobacteria bacterium]
MSFTIGVKPKSKPMNRWNSIRHEELTERLSWLVNLRWLTIVFIILAYLAANLAFNLEIETQPLLVIVIVIAAYNLIFHLYIKSKKTDITAKAGDIAFIQAVLDVLALTAFIHWTSGIENPFIFYFIFHTIITSILLPKNRSFAQAFLICILIGLLALLEYIEVLPHHEIKGFLTAGFYKEPIYVIAVYFTFASTILIATFIAVSISENLYKKELELKKVGKELEDANLKLLEKDRLKSEYVMMVAHDIKSPLSSVLSMIDAVIEGFAGEIEDKVMDMFIRIKHRVGNVHHYVADLLDLSRFRSIQKLNLEDFKIRDVIDESSKFAMPKGEGKHIDLMIDAPDEIPMITADREQIRYVFINLLANALKYTPDGGKVKVIVRATPDTINVEVSDTGIGIPKDDISKIFTEFFRAGNVRDTTKGTGLGLALVRHIIERHNGKIWVLSELGKGAAFKFVLPIRQISNNQITNSK